MDYRVSKYENKTFSEIKNDKKSLSNDIDRNVLNENNKGNHYRKISNKRSSYYNDFQRIYNNKCAYCGINIEINNASLYEIDHFFCKSIYSNQNEIEHIDNLIFSCKTCNQSKKDFDVKNICGLVHPDGDSIANVFVRGKHYEILVSKEYKNENICKYFAKMKFDSKFRKLDFLLLNLFHMKNINIDDRKKEAISKLYLKLLELRNSEPSLK
ncbi:HNH endonuclease [Actinobacillus equuli subsp. haemolyticus]|nr:HNH endonuclease [Actinobacillus equuli subsp. haemolyticus]